jgi:hypothetical protein
MECDLVITGVYVSGKLYIWGGNAFLLYNINTNDLPIILVQKQLLLLPGGMKVPEDDVVKIYRICLVGIKEKAIWHKSINTANHSMGSLFLHSASNVSFGWLP